MLVKLVSLLVVFGFVCGKVVGQEVERRKVAVAGMVCDRDSLTPLAGATCRSGNVAEGADEEGRFFLTAEVGDTIRFSHVGYVPVEMVVSDSLGRDNYLLGVFMSCDTVMLSEVVIVPRFLDREIRLNPFLQNAYQNLNEAVWAASQPVERMDREMNQRMQIEEFARQVEMKGMVDVQFGVGLYTFQTLKALKASRKNEIRRLATSREVDLLKRVFNAEKKGKSNN